MKWVYRNGFHYVAGAIAGWFLHHNPVGSMVLVLAFLAYELAQDWRKEDCSFKDIFEFVVPLFVVASIIEVWRLVI